MIEDYIGDASPQSRDGPCSYEYYKENFCSLLLVVASVLSALAQATLCVRVVVRVV